LNWQGRTTSQGDGGYYKSQKNRWASGRVIVVQTGLGKRPFLSVKRAREERGAPKTRFVPGGLVTPTGSTSLSRFSRRRKWRKNRPTPGEAPQNRMKVGGSVRHKEQWGGGGGVFLDAPSPLKPQLSPKKKGEGQAPTELSKELRASGMGAGDQVENTLPKVRAASSVQGGKRG